MSNTPHRLHEEFPGATQKMHDLKVSNTHFARLMADYAAVNDKVHRAEARVDLMSDAEEEVLRKKRAHLKDEIARMLQG